MRRLLNLAVALLVAGCANAPAGPPGATRGGASPTTPTETGASVESPAVPPSAAVSPPPTAQPIVDVTPTPVGLHTYGWARIVIPELNVRERPSISAPELEEGHSDAPPTPVRFGTASGIDDVFVLAGPVEADGYTWWQVSPTEYLNFVRMGSDEVAAFPAPIANLPVGWVATGPRRDPWLVPVPASCPGAPVKVAAITAKVASWAVRLGCFRGQTLTLRGWMGGGHSIWPVKPLSYSGRDSIDRLDFFLFPRTLPIPDEDQWVEIVGQFDHPSARDCEDYDALDCRATFVATSVTGLGE